MQTPLGRISTVLLGAILTSMVIIGAVLPTPQVARIERDTMQVFTTGRGTVEHALESELKWLKSTQRPDGAITMNAQRDRVIPYFSNLAALALLETDPGAVRLYMEWYLERLNMPDRFGMSGTIYDHYYHNGSERVTQDYDSADSYAATFLSLVRAYQQKTDDRDWVLANLPKIELVAQVITTLQDTDGLVWAKPNHKMKYLMDNSENFKGLRDWADTLGEVGHKKEAGYYRDRAQAVRDGIETKLWDSRRQMYLWGIGRVVRRLPRNGIWYPDNVAQIYPAVFGVIPETGDRAKALYAKVNEEFPDWPEYTKDDPYPWTIMAYSAARMGDIDRVARFLDVTDRRFIRAGRPNPWWHAMESGFYLLTCQIVDRHMNTASR